MISSSKEVDSHTNLNAVIQTASQKSHGHLKDVNPEDTWVKSKE